MKHSGIATLNLFVDEKGMVTDVSILNSSGNDKYDKNTLKAAKKWIFKPSLCDGKPTPAHFVVAMQSHAD